MEVIENLTQLVKSFIQSNIGISRDMLHFVGGIIFYSSWLLIFRNKRTSFTPIILLLSMAFVNEFIDLFYYFNKMGKWRWLESISDILYTVLVQVFVYFAINKYVKCKKVPNFF